MGYLSECTPSMHASMVQFKPSTVMNELVLDIGVYFILHLF